MNRRQVLKGSIAATASLVVSGNNLEAMTTPKTKSTSRESKSFSLPLVL
ncbi:MAG: twin-arginine translocation signal domain-containing protein [Saprospiraceae bacterium]|nr:twin-arginine translocation signal domain-containing protein [Saprospiraceae bacterium]